MYNTKIYRCLKCGWQKETDTHDLICPICHSDLQVEINDKKETEEILKQMEKSALQDMERAIKEEGHAKIWYDIETIKEALTRIEERQIFIKAGGKIPKKEIKL